MKPFIKGKPIWYGFKCWCLTSSEGYILKCHPYCGKGGKIEGKTLGSIVTKKLCNNYLAERSSVFLDNILNPLSFLQELKRKKITCVGTLRSDRIKKAPLKDVEVYSLYTIAT